MTIAGFRFKIQSHGLQTNKQVAQTEIGDKFCYIWIKLIDDGWRWTIWTVMKRINHMKRKTRKERQHIFTGEIKLTTSATENMAL